MTKPEDFDYVKMFFGIVSAISGIVMPIVISWLIKNFKALKKSNEHIDAMKQHLADEAKNQYNRNIEFNNSLQTQINNALNNLNAELERKTGMYNYETDRNRKGIDNLCDQLMISVDRFDNKVKDATIRLKSEMITKETYYQETSKLKDDFLKDVMLARTSVSDIKTTPSNVNISKDLRTLNNKIETLTNRFNNEQKSVDSKLKLSMRLSKSELHERKQITIELNNLKLEVKKKNLEMLHKLDNYNMLLSSMKGKLDKK